MATILNIETSTDVCSVSASQDGACIFNVEDHEGPNHAVVLGRFVDEALSFIDSHAIPLDAVCVSGGPGSYTGLRIGVSMAKGVCYGAGVPLISVPTIELLCVPVLLSVNEEIRKKNKEIGGEDYIPDDVLLCPMLDARRMEVYAAVYDRTLRVKRPLQADVVTADTYKEWLDEHPVYFFGNGAKKCMEVINHPNAHLINNIEPLAKWMFPLAERRLMNNQTEDVAYYTPNYLKDFQATKAKNPLGIKL